LHHFNKTLGWRALPKGWLRSTSTWSLP